MNAYRVLVNSTQLHDFYCVYFSDYCTGTMSKEKADSLIDWLQTKSTVTIGELKKVFRYSSVGLYYKSPIHRVM